MTATERASSFIKTLSVLAMEEYKKRKEAGQKWILPSVCIAQAAFETGWGTSAIMTKANAYFGIKAGTDWRGKVYSTKTKECYDGVNYTTITDLFRAYDSPADSVEDYFNLITGLGRYALACNQTDAKTCIQAIKDGDYATSPAYVDNVMSIIAQYDLTQYDREETKVSLLQKFIDLGDYYADAAGNGKTPYLEKKSNAYLDDFTKNAGNKNYTKFARDVNTWGQPGCQAQPWCAEYQFWKLATILGITKALKIMGGGFYNCASVKNYAKAAGTWHSTPKKGCLVIFRNGSHIGSVNSYDAAYIHTNEGNTSSAPGVVDNGGSARNKTYKRTSPDIDGYVWIDWDDTKEEVWKATGTAVSTVDHLYVRETPNGYILGELMKGNRFEVDGETSGNWTKVKVANIGVGYVWTAYTKKDGQQNAATTIKNKQDKTERLFVGSVTAKETKVRTWAGGEYPQIKKWPVLAKGNLIDVMNYTQTAKDGSKWYYVRIANKYYGFVNSKHVQRV